MVAVFVAGGLLYTLSPAARPGLHASAPILLAMLPAALAGVVCRVALDLLEGRRGAQAREPWPLLPSALLLVGAAGWMVAGGWHLVETTPLAGDLCEGMLALLLPLLSLGAVVLAARAGYLDGEDRGLTLRAPRKEPALSPVPALLRRKAR